MQMYKSFLKTLIKTFYFLTEPAEIFLFFLIFTHNKNKHGFVTTPNKINQTEKTITWNFNFKN